MYYTDSQFYSLNKTRKGLIVSPFFFIKAIIDQLDHKATKVYSFCSDIY